MRHEMKPFEIPEEDFLTARPVGGGLLEIEPPPWAVAAITKRQGKHGPKYPKHCLNKYQGGYNPAWGSQDSFHDVNGSVHGPWIPIHSATDNVARRNADAEEAYQKARAKLERKRQYRLDATLAARKAVPPGNLKEDDYRFWIGDPQENALRSQCKWCEKYAWNNVERVAHMRSGNQCSSRLLILYSYAYREGDKKQTYCFACKKETRHQRWGVPLCNTISCIGRWKFSPVYTLQGMVQYRDWLDEANPCPLDKLGPELPRGSYR